MENVCSACHTQGWIDGHFKRLDRSIETSNHMTLQATKVLSAAWGEGLAQGLPQGANPFDEAIELQWIEQWAVLWQLRTLCHGHGWSGLRRVCRRTLDPDQESARDGRLSEVPACNQAGGK